MVVSDFYDCVSALLKYRSYQKIFSAIALFETGETFKNSWFRKWVAEEALMYWVSYGGSVRD